MHLDKVLSFRHISDGFWECPNGEDEEKCKFLHTCADLFVCVRAQVKVCLHPVSVCDDTYDCISHEDEQLCDLPFTCPEYCQCLLYAIACANFHLSGVSSLGGFKNVTHQKFVNVTKSAEHVHQMITHFQKLLIFVWTNSALTHRDLCFSNNHSNILFLDYHSNDVVDLSKCSLSGFKHLRILDLRQNKINRIAENTFEKLQKIIKIDLSQNCLTDWHSGVFAPLCLVHLNLTQNIIVSASDNLVDKVRISFLSSNDFKICCLFEQEGTDTVCSQEPTWPQSCQHLFTLASSVVVYFVVTLIIGLNLFAFVSGVRQIIKAKSRKYSMRGNVKVAKKPESVAIACSLLFLILACVGNHFQQNIFQLYIWLSSVHCFGFGLLFSYTFLFSIFEVNFLSITKLFATNFPFISTFKRTKSVLRYLSQGSISLCLVCVVFVALYVYLERQENMPTSMCSFLGETTFSICVKCFTIVGIVLQISGSCSLLIETTLIIRELVTASVINPTAKSDQKTAAIQQAVMTTVASSLCWLPSSAVCIVTLSMNSYPLKMLLWNIILILPLNPILNPLIFCVFPLIRKALKRRQRHQLKHQTGPLQVELQNSSDDRCHFQP